MSGKLVLIPCEGPITDFGDVPGDEPELKPIQQAVGGWVEQVVVVYEGKRCYAFVNEEGLLKQYRVNVRATDLFRLAAFRGDQRIVGPMVVWVQP